MTKEPKNILGKIQALFKIFRLNIFVVVPILTTLITSIYTLITVLLNSIDYSLLFSSAVSLGVTIVSFVTTLYICYRNQKNILFYKYPKEEIDEALSDPINYSKLQYIEINGVYLVYTNEENLITQTKIMDLPYSFKGNYSYKVPKNISKNAYSIFTHIYKKRVNFFDGRKIRMNEDFLDVYSRKNSEQVIQLSKTTYFNSICTNEIASLEIRSASDTTYRFDGFTLVKSYEECNTKSRIFKLKESVCSNHIGVSTLLLTKDNYVILTMQGNKNYIESKKYTLSASGSLEYKDKKGCKTFGDIIVKGMNRELSEECNIPYSSIIDTKLIGYGRLLNRGGKPEFFGITRVNLAAEEVVALAKKGIETKREYVTDFIAIRFKKETLLSTIKEFEINGSLTAQLFYTIHKLI